MRYSFYNRFEYSANDVITIARGLLGDSWGWVVRDFDGFWVFTNWEDVSAILTLGGRLVCSITPGLVGSGCGAEGAAKLEPMPDSVK